MAGSLIKVTVPKIVLSPAFKATVASVGNEIANAGQAARKAVDGLAARVRTGLASAARTLSAVVMRALPIGAAAAGIIAAGRAATALLRRAAERDDGLRRALVATQKLFDSLVLGVISSKVAQRGLEMAAGAMTRAADAFLRFVDSGKAERAWKAVTVSLYQFVGLADDLARGVVLRLETIVIDVLLDVLAGVTQKRTAGLELGGTQIGAVRPQTDEELSRALGAAVTIPGGATFTEPQNVIIDDARALVQRLGFDSRALEGRRAAVVAEVAAIEQRIASRDAVLADATGLGGGDEGSGSSSAEAGVAERTGVARVLDTLEAWTTSPAMRGVMANLVAVVTEVQGNVSAILDRFGGVVRGLRTSLLAHRDDLQPVLLATEAGVSAFATLSRTVEMVGSANVQVAKTLGRFELHFIAVSSLALAAVETAAGIAAATSFDVARAILHFTAAAALGTAAAIATGNAVGAFGSPRDARAIADQRIGRIRGGLASARPASVLLVVDGDTDLEHQAWVRRNILDVITTFGEKPPEDIRVPTGGSLGSRQDRAIARMIFDQSPIFGGGSLGERARRDPLFRLLELAFGPHEDWPAVRAGKKVEREFRRARRRTSREIGRAKRRLKKIF